MAIELSASHPRRAILAAAGGAIAALVAQALGRPLPARAEGEIIHVGDEHSTATSRTLIRNVTNPETVLMVSSGGGGIGILGTSGSGTAVRGSSSSGAGVQATSGTGTGLVGRSTASVGVYAESSGAGQPALFGRSLASSAAVLGVTGPAPAAYPLKAGVYGYSVEDGGSKGVWGRSNSGMGVYGQATSGRAVRGWASSGTAVSAEATSGIALHAKGRVQLETSSGTDTILAGTRTRKVSPGFNLTSTTKVLVTLMGDPGGSTVVQRVAVDAIANDFTVFLTANAAANTNFAWLVLE